MGACLDGVACCGGVHRDRVAAASQRPSIYPLDKDFPVRESRHQPAEACSKIHRLTFPPLDNFCLKIQGRLRRSDGVGVLRRREALVPRYDRPTPVDIPSG